MTSSRTPFNTCLKLRQILGPTYGGPSLSFDKVSNQYIIYKWHDAPVDEEILATGTSLTDVIKNFYKNQKK